jgi:hypothetical protein
MRWMDGWMDGLQSHAYMHTYIHAYALHHMYIYTYTLAEVEDGGGAYIHTYTYIPTLDPLYKTLMSAHMKKIVSHLIEKQSKG